jgi:hypothetical protein
MKIIKQCDNCANRDICKHKAAYDKLCETVTDALRHNWMITDLPDGAPGIVNMSEIPQIGIVVTCGHRTPHGFASGGGGWGYCGVSGGSMTTT